MLICIIYFVLGVCIPCQEKALAHGHLLAVRAGVGDHVLIQCNGTTLSFPEWSINEVTINGGNKQDYFDNGFHVWAGRDEVSSVWSIYLEIINTRREQNGSRLMCRHYTTYVYCGQLFVEEGRQLPPPVNLQLYSLPCSSAVRFVWSPPKPTRFTASEAATVRVNHHISHYVLLVSGQGLYTGIKTNHSFAVNETLLGIELSVPGLYDCVAYSVAVVAAGESEVGASAAKSFYYLKAQHGLSALASIEQIHGRTTYPLDSKVCDILPTIDNALHSTCRNNSTTVSSLNISISLGNLEDDNTHCHGCEATLLLTAAICTVSQNRSFTVTSDPPTSYSTPSLPSSSSSSRSSSNPTSDSTDQNSTTTEPNGTDPPMWKSLAIGSSSALLLVILLFTAAILLLMVFCGLVRKADGSNTVDVREAPIEVGDNSAYSIIHNKIQRRNHNTLV